MKIEKLTENKIRIIVKLEELSNSDIDLNDFMLNNVTFQKFFLDILNKAEKEVGFNTKDCKLLIETFSSIDEVFVFTITKFAKDKRNKRGNKIKYSKKSQVIKNPIYKFSCFDEFCDLCEALHMCNISIVGICKKVSLYLYNDTYYLVFSNLNLNYRFFKKLFSVLSEFGILENDCDRLEAKLLEYGKPIIKQNALRTGIKYFA